MSESVETESQGSVSDDETQDSPSPPKETMEVDVDGDTLSETQESDTNDNKENKNKSSNKPSKKRKNTSPDTDTNNPKKKRKISKDNKNNKNNETDKKQHKKRRAGRPPKKDIDGDGDSTMERKKRKSIVRDLKDSIPQYLQLSDDENDNKNKNKKNKEKSNRLLKQQQALMTQEPNDMESDDIMDSDDENEVKQREKNIKHLCDVKLEEIQLLSTQTIHRLCNRHKIVIHKPLNATELEEKQKCEEEKKKYRRVYDDSKYISNKKLVKELKREKKILDKEININNLDDVKKKRDIGEFKRDTIVRLCKHHRIQANQKLMKMIQCLEDRWENPSDEDDHIETLKDIKDIDEIQHLSREVLIRLCNAHGVQTVKKKKKKKKRKKKKKGDDSDSDSDSDDDDDDDDNDDDDDVIDLSDEELIKALEDIKKKMNEAKHKKQKSQIEKLELMQENMLNIGFRDNYLTVSGDENFKDKCRNLIAVCNSEVTNKSLCYDLVDDELGQYKVCVSESGARTIKVMMTVARGGSIVNDKWISHSIKGKRWANPQNYEKEFGNWKNAAEKYRDSVIKKRKRTKKKDKDGDNDMNSSDSEKEIGTSGPLLSDYSIYVQDRPSKIKPSSLSLKHLAWNAGAQIVNQNWKNERLKKKEVNDGLDDEKDESDSDHNRNNKNSNKKLSKKSSRKSSKKTSKRKKKKDDSDDDDDDDDDDSDNDSDNDSGNDKEEAGDEDSDIEENKNKNKNKKRRKKTKDSGKKKKKIKASRSIGEDSGKKKRKTVLRKYKLIISHPAIYKDLPKEMKKNKNDIFIVGQKWLFESIENFTIEDEENYIVKPNKNRSRSPAH